MQLRTSRLTLQTPTVSDRVGMIQLTCHPDVRRFLGGPPTMCAFLRRLSPFLLHKVRARMAESRVAQAAEDPDPGYAYAVVSSDTDTFVGYVSVQRHAPGRPASTDELELSYVFLPQFWGHGFAVEACRALLAHVAALESEETIILITQTANTASLALARRLGFAPAAEFVEFDAQQTLARASLVSFRS